jgi:hypothetical protein
VSVALGHYILKAAWPSAWFIANGGTNNEALIVRIRQAGQALGLQHGERIVLRRVVLRLVRVVPEKAALF